MKLIKPSFEILKLDDGETILKDIEIASRTCYQSEGKIEYEDGYNNCGIPDRHNYTAKSARTLIPKLIARKHYAMLEFASMTVKFITDRGVSHELVRHRLCSFAQESTRYCNYGKDEHISFIIPSHLDIRVCSINTMQQYTMLGYYGNSTITVDEIDWITDMFYCEKAYNNKIRGVDPKTNTIDNRRKKWSPQEARSVLPNSLKTEIVVKANLREWRTIFEQRTSNAAHPDMRAIMRPLLDEVKNRIPIIFDDISY